MYSLIQAEKLMVEKRRCRGLALLSLADQIPVILRRPVLLSYTAVLDSKSQEPGDVAESLPPASGTRRCWMGRGHGPQHSSPITWCPGPLKHLQGFLQMAAVGEVPGASFHTTALFH
jgi:hypothetical protein